MHCTLLRDRGKAGSGGVAGAEYDEDKFISEGAGLLPRERRFALINPSAQCRLMASILHYYLHLLMGSKRKLKATTLVRVMTFAAPTFPAAGVRGGPR